MAEEKTTAAPNVRPYDFRSPERLTSTTKAVLVPAQQKLAENLADALGSELDCPCTVTFGGAEERSTSSFLQKETDPVYRLIPSDGRGEVFLAIDSALAQTLIDRILGGPGAAREVDRPPTDIESAVLAHVASTGAEAIAASWDTGDTPSGEPASLDSAARRDVESTVGVICSFPVTLSPEGAEGETPSGALRLFYDLDDLGDVLGFGKAVEENSTSPETITAEHLGAMRLYMNARYRATPVQIRDLTSLQVGDVLYLDHKLTDEVEITFDGRIAFFGHPGAVDSSIGVRISRTSDE